MKLLLEKPVLEITKEAAQRFIVLMNAYNKASAPPGAGVSKGSRKSSSASPAVIPMPAGDPKVQDEVRSALFGYLQSLSLVQLKELQVMVRMGAGEYAPSQWVTACELEVLGADRRAEMEKLVRMAWQNRRPIDGLSALIFEEIL